MEAAGVAAAAGGSLHGQPPFDDLFAAVGWHPAHRRLLQLLANVTTQGSNIDTADLAAAMLEVGWTGSPAVGKGPHGGGGGGGSDPAGPVDISLLGLFLGVVVIGINGLISLWLRLGLHGKLAVATVR